MNETKQINFKINQHKVNSSKGLNENYSNRFRMENNNLKVQLDDMWENKSLIY